ncbi:MAG TPA: hypothetical protein VHX37_13830 [Acidobacteriaceae bacterium]|jgi:hypothetical protein|nr:hypothetical protein [Acidobacteriaceae bacterium]
MGKWYVEADWAVEIGAGLERIDADWSGLVDLRTEPQRVGEITEAAGRPALRETLLDLNAAASPVFTSRCDVWKLEGEIDPLEFEASPETSAGGMACYLDVLSRDAALFASFERHEAWVRLAVLTLRQVERHQGRVDLVVRAAEYRGEAGFGITLYAAGCGRDTRAAEAAWGAALRAAAAATMRVARSVGE